MSSDVDAYTLTGPDSSAFCALIQAQAAVGPAQPSPTQAQFWAFFAAIDSIYYDHSPFITNAKVNDWTQKLFVALMQTQTCYGIHGAGLYALYEYAQFTGACFTTGNLGQTGPDQWPPNLFGYDTFFLNLDAVGLQGASPWNYLAYMPDPANPVTGVWVVHQSWPVGFYNALCQDINVLNKALQDAGKSTSTVALFQGYGGTCPDPDTVQQFEQSRFDPKNWTDSDTFVQNLIRTELWEQQSAAVAALLEPATLSADDYFFLLHLLVTLGTSTASDQRLAQQIVGATANSPEYPNDTFINQLVYLTLMYLADPSGNFGWTNAQLQAQMDLLAGAITSPDPASQAIHTSLAQHKRVLQTDASYPMQDPYSPAIGFTQRKTDTLYALDSARKAISG